MTNSWAVQARELHVTRGGRQVLSGLTFSLPAGSITGLLGPSGCGKTTLMRAVVGVQQGVSGELTVLGRRPGDPALRERVGYVTQAPAVYGDLSVRANLRYFADVLGADPARVDGALDAVRLTAQAGRRVDTLSGGQRARASLATALLGAPELLVLDEPTVGLDPLVRRDLWRLFDDLACSGTTLLVSSHVMEEATHCSRLLLVREGRLVADEPPAALLARTGTADVDAAFLALAAASPATVVA
ncbi:MAG: ABC transporter ATP-binding protein [Actinomycetota bacterium]|nr:ABC transporter ATP-binding protein [Actinomycetota bacterium]